MARVNHIHIRARARACFRPPDREGATVGCCYRSFSAKAHVAVFSVCKPQRVQATDRRLDKILIRSAVGLSCEGSPLTHRASRSGTTRARVVPRAVCNSASSFSALSLSPLSPSLTHFLSLSLSVPSFLAADEGPPLHRPACRLQRVT
jgi:hypothetical protein